MGKDSHLSKLRGHIFRSGEAPVTSEKDHVPLECKLDYNHYLEEYERHDPLDAPLFLESEADIIEADDCRYLYDALGEDRVRHAKDMAIRLCRSEYGPNDFFIKYFTADPLEIKAIQTILTRSRTVKKMREAAQIQGTFEDWRPRYVISCFQNDCSICKCWDGKEFEFGSKDSKFPPFCLGCRCKVTLVPVEVMRYKPDQ